MAYVGEKFWDKTAAKYAQDPVRDEQTYQRKLSETQAVLKADMNLFLESYRRYTNELCLLPLGKR